MSNSPLVCYTKISPNRNSPRNHAIDTITIHCVVGQLSAESICGCFTSPDRQASCNYGIGTDGRISLCVEEKDRSWCSSSSANDNRAITIECASDKSEPYAVNDKVYAALIDLCTDICKRNNIKELKWKADKSLIGQVEKQNMTVHRWFANKSCPGNYLYNLHGEIATAVNKRLNGNTETPPTDDALYRVQVGAFGRKDYAERLEAELKAKGFDTYLIQADGFHKVQVGAYSVKANADAMLNKLKAAGYDAFITAKGGSPASPSTPAPAAITVGSRVKLKSGATTYTGGSIAGFVYNDTWIVLELSGSRAVIDKNVSGTNSICTPVNVADLTLV